MSWPRSSSDDDVVVYVSPQQQVNAGLWTLWAGATLFLGLRVYCKVSRRNWLWYDDYILITAWLILMLNNALISVEYATGYVTPKWDDRMHILINISSCGTVIGQSLTKTAFAVTLLRMTKGWQWWFLWFCIVTMNIWMVLRCLFEWAKVCDKSSYQQWYRLNFCIYYNFRSDFKEGGNVYNVIMDFAFATFPWIITWPLEIRRIEKVALCMTMSLGMVVAIVAAVRIAWKDDGNSHGTWYFWNLGMSNIWYSSEVAGTIIVQCIPLLRPLIREIHTSITSKKLESTTYTTDARSSNWRDSRRDTAQFRNSNNYQDRKEPIVHESIALRDIPEAVEEAPRLETTEREIMRSPLSPSRGDRSPGDVYLPIHSEVTERGPDARDSDFWPFPPPGSRDSEMGDSRNGHHTDWLDLEEDGASGLRPPPPQRLGRRPML